MTTTLEAGRELDTLVAEKVMGWTKWRSPVVPRGSAEPDCWLTNDRTSPTFKIAHWSPSTDIACAWQVVERMRDRGFALELHYEFGCSIQWVADFSNDGWSSTGEQLGDTAPLAICRAALAAVEAA
jgi:hypothetical protein